MKAKLTPAVRALANGTANDKEAKPFLKGVYIRGREAAAADGFLLVIKQLPPDELPLDGPHQDDGIDEVIIPADALKACKGDIQMECIEVIKADPGLLTKLEPKIVVRLNGPDYDVEAESISGTFPDYTALFPPSPLIGQVALNTSLLKKLLRTLPDDSNMILRISEPERPVEFQCADPDGDIPIRGLIMPLHLAWNLIKWKSTNDTPSEQEER